jgi:hypothetical protein
MRSVQALREIFGGASGCHIGGPCHYLFVKLMRDPLVQARTPDEACTPGLHCAARDSRCTA